MHACLLAYIEYIFIVLYPIVVVSIILSRIIILFYIPLHFTSEHHHHNKIPYPYREAAANCE